jgi:hypothetical protein
MNLKQRIAASVALVLSATILTSSALSPKRDPVREDNYCCVPGFGSGGPDNSQCEVTCHQWNQCPNSSAYEAWIPAHCLSAPPLKCKINYGGTSVTVLKFSCYRPGSSNCLMPGNINGYSCLYTQIGTATINALQCSRDSDGNPLGDECHGGPGGGDGGGG